jgi:hypothetical protein
VFYVWILIGLECLQYIRKGRAVVLEAPAAIRTAAYLLLFYLILIYGAMEGHEFIYFQF